MLQNRALKQTVQDLQAKVTSLSEENERLTEELTSRGAECDAKIDDEIFHESIPSQQIDFLNLNESKFLNTPKSKQRATSPSHSVQVTNICSQEAASPSSLSYLQLSLY